MERLIPISCNRDCGGGCPLIATVRDGRVVSIADSPHRGPAMHGCVRGYQAARTLYAPDRLRQPLLRTGPRGSGQFVEIGWPEALDRVAEGLSAVKARYGSPAVLSLGGSGSCRGALHNTGLLKTRFLSLFGGHTATFGSYSAAAALYATPYVLGTTHAGIDPGTLQYSKMIILWGANVIDCREGCELESRLREARQRGVEIVAIDPRRSATVHQLATQWIPVRPGADVALMMAVLHVLITEGLVDTAFVRRYASGYDELQRTILGLDGSEAKSPAWAERLCGTPAETITAFARSYGQARPTALIPGLSIQRTIGGEEAVRMAIALQVATANLGVLGGSSGAQTWNRLPQPRMGRMSAPAAPQRAAVPVYRWPDAVLEGRGGGYPSDIHAIYNVGGNYIVQGSDVRKNMRAFESVDLAVCHDFFLTPTARHCDVVLPSTTFMERQDIVFPDSNFLLFSNRAVEPLHETRNDYDIFCALAERLGFLHEFSEDRDEEGWLRHFVSESEVPDYEEFRRTGIYMAPDQLRVGLSDFRRDPQAHALQTPSGRVELSSAAYALTGYPATPQPRILPADEAYPLRLVTPKSRYRVHSQNSNIAWFREREHQALWINPADASLRGVHDGDKVLVGSPTGRVLIPAHVTTDMTPGVVCLLEGVWPEFDIDGIDTAGCANVLTSTEPTMPSQGSRTHSVLVQVAIPATTA